MASSSERLLQQIRLGEDTAFELKAVTFRGNKLRGPRREELADEIAAMANTVGGTLLLGVDDKTREILGIPVEKLDAVERVLFEICSDSITPPVAFHIFRRELPDDMGSPRAVLEVEIPRSLFVHRSAGGYFWRQGSSKRELPPDVLARLFQQRSQARIIRFDEQVVPDTGFEDLQEPLWRRFVGQTGEDPRLTLRKLSLLRKDDQDEVERATVAGVLMCTAHPERWLPGAAVMAVRYRGLRRDANYQLDAQEIQGPLDRQVFETLDFAVRNMSVAAFKAPGRVDVPQYSERALFEAIVNAVAHRDYSISGSKIRLFMFDDRLELYSPGALPNTLTVGSMALRQSTRNELVTSLLAKCPVPDGKELGRTYLMDRRGEGVPIIYDESRRLGSNEPSYRLLDEAELFLTIWAAPLPAQDGVLDEA